MEKQNKKIPVTNNWINKVPSNLSERKQACVADVQTASRAKEPLSALRGRGPPLVLTAQD